MALHSYLPPIKLSLLILPLFIGSCIGFDCGSGHRYELAPDYILHLNEGGGPWSLHLDYGAPLVSRVIAFSVHEKYILVQGLDGQESLDYYIVKILPPPVDWDPDLAWSYLEKQEFDSITNQLGIRKIEWKYLEKPDS